MISGIYEFVNLLDRKHYIGSSENIERRRNQHVRNLRCNTHDNCHLQSAWNKYGEDKFSFNILKECDPDDLLLWEQLYVNCYEPEQLYNINLEVERPPAKTAEIRKKISAAVRGRITSEETKRKIRALAQGRKASDDAKRKMSVSQRGRKHTEETKRKIGDANRGRKYSDESRKKMSEKRRSRPAYTDETKRKISESRLGKKHSEETRKKMSDANKRRKPASVETRRKISESLKAYNAARLSVGKSEPSA